MDTAEPAIDAVEFNMVGAPSITFRPASVIAASPRLF
jgi:hypothetical protein